MNSSKIIRHGVTTRWSDAVVHRGVVYFVEVPDDVSLDAPCQFTQVLEQVDKRLAEVGSDRTGLLQVIIYLPQAEDLVTFNERWDAWIPKGHAPSRACIHASLAAKEYRVELVVTAAVNEDF
jgi:enamine deaminase RidA (YjgF/YER057c/UK114 family)